MTYTPKKLGAGQLTASETTMYTPAASTLRGIVGKLTFYNTSTTAQVTVTLYCTHTGAAGSDDVLETVVLNPLETYICRAAINEVIVYGDVISALASTALLVNYSIHGGEQ